MDHYPNYIIHQFVAHSQAIFDSAISKNGRLFGTCSSDQTIRVWSLEDFHEILQLDTPTYVSRICFSDNAKQIFSNSGYEEGFCIQIWSLYNKKIEQRIKGQERSMQNFLLINLNQRRILISISSNDPIKLWDIDSNMLFYEIPRNLYYGVGTITMSPDNTKLLYTSNFEINGLREWAPGFNPIGVRLRNQCLVLWDLTTKSKLHTYSPLHAQIPESEWLTIDLLNNMNMIVSCAISHNQRWILGGFADNTLHMWDIESSQQIRVFGDRHDPNIHGAEACTCCLFSPDDQLIITGYHQVIHGDFLLVWDASTGERLFHLEGHSDSISSLTITPDDKYLLSTSADGTVIVWDFPKIMETFMQIRITAIIHKIKENISLIDAEKQFPYYWKFENELTTVCQQYQNKTSREILSILTKKN